MAKSSAGLLRSFLRVKDIIELEAKVPLGALFTALGHYAGSVDVYWVARVGARVDLSFES